MPDLSKFIVRAILVPLLFIMTAGPAGSADGGRASGQFESNDITMKITDAYSFYGAPSLGGKDKVIIVVVSNKGFVQSALDEYWDRRNALERYFRDEDTGLVYFEFDTTGRYRGMSYYFGSGNGCGYCADPSVVSTVSLNKNRIAGELSLPKDSDPNRWFNISIDAVVSDDDHGKPQGAGGGEPGKAYLKYHRTITDKDQRAIKALLSEERRAAWDSAEAKENGAAFLSFLREEHPKDVRVTKAYVKGDRALLLLEGRGETGKIRGEARLIRQQGTWRFVEETFSAVQ